MTRYGMVIDITRCSGCYNCQLACKDEHCGYDYPGYTAPQPETGHFWMRVTEKERGRYPRVKVACTAIPCQHCITAPCIDKAENNAVYRRPDGIVIIDPEKAKGQRHLVDACSYGAIYWNEELSLPQKCTFCAHLLDQGWKEPRCAEVCPAGAICFGDLDDPESGVSQLVASGKTEVLHPEYGLEGNVRYIGLPKRFVAGTVVFADTDECAGGVRVVLNSHDNTESSETVTNNFGDFEFEDLKADTDYQLKFEAEGYHPLEVTENTADDVYLGEVFLEKVHVKR